MANDIDKTSPHYKGDFGSIYEVNKKFPTGGVAGDFVVIEGWAHYWNADRATWCVNAERDSYWDELITNIIEKFKLVRGATYMGVASLDTVPAKVIGAKMYYFATVAGTYKNFGDLAVPQGINVLYSENGSSWVNTTLLEVAQELGVSTKKVVSQKALNDALNLKANQNSVNEALAKKADKEEMNRLLAEKANSADVNTKFAEEKKRVDDELGKKFDKASVAQESGDSEELVMSQKAVSDKLNDLADNTEIRNEDGATIKTPFREIESPEFIKVIVDANDHLLFSINLDGEVDWGKGIPAPIRAKLQEIITQCQQDKTDILESINTLNGILDKTTIKDEEGNVQDTPFKVIENEEFIKAVVDSENRVLCGIYRATGKPYYPLNDMYHVSHYDEFLWVILDAVNHPLLGIKEDGTCWAAKAQWLDDIKAIKEALSSIDKTLKTLQPREDGKGLINIEIADSFFYISNDEYIIAVVDAENRILAGIKYDGEPYFPNHEMYSVITNEEWLYAIIDADSKVLGGFRADDGHMIIGGIDISNFIANAIIEVADIKERTCHLSTIENDEYLSVETDADGKVLGYTAPDGSHYLYKVKSETIPGEFEHIEDPEGRTEMTTDAEGKILGYRDIEGTRHEHKISANHINLSDEAAKEVNEAFKSAGIKMENPSDFSKDSYVELPIPRIAAQVRIYAPKLPTTKQDDIEAEIEYNDKDGNYFRKPVILNSQGSSSMSYIDKKTGERGNMAIDINDNSKIKFGDFPLQDSFHLKKYYIDAFRGQCIVGYWLTEQVYKSRPAGQQYPYESSIPNNSSIDGLGSINKDFFTGAKCHPDGFPIVITWIDSQGIEKNMGVYTWNLKKSKEVYFADKKKAENIILDGVINNNTIWGGKISWSSFEIRNPKSLKDINGDKYDGDNPKELSDSDVLSKKVKDYLLRWSNCWTEITSNKTKETYEKYFHVDFFIDYYIISQVIYNIDGFTKNWIWCTWDGLHWTPTLYDLDSVFGSHWNGTCIIPESDTKGIIGWVLDFEKIYAEEIKARYKELRNLGIFSLENIMGLFDKWLNMIGYENLKADLEQYNQTPSYRGSNINNEYWELVRLELSGQEEQYNNTKEYSVGDICYIDGNNPAYVFKCVKSCTGQAPFLAVYDTLPTYCGYYNSPHRVANWLKNRIEFLDNNYSYTK